MAEAWEADGDGGAFAWRAADGDGAAMFFDDLLDGGEPQTDAGLLRGEKRFKDLVDDFCRDWNSIVLDEDVIFHAAPSAVLGDLNMKMPARVHRFARVLENTEKDLLEFGFVAADRGDHCRVVLGYLYSGDFKVGRNHCERALDHFGDAEEPSSELKRFREVQNFIQDGFDTDQIAHRILDTRLWVEVEDPFTRDFFQLGADRSERLTNLCGQEHAELADGGLPLLFSDYGLRGARS